jgi:hypothetical protein
MKRGAFNAEKKGVSGDSWPWLIIKNITGSG